jgi:uncharacterized protein (TIGR03066 family)
MKRFVAAMAALVVLVGASSAQDTKVDPAKLVGKWELTKSESGGAPKGAIVEFTKDNKLSISATDKDGNKLDFTGTYKVEGDKLTVTIAFAGKEDSDTDTIKMLTDEKLVLVDKDKKETEFVKKK